jgi:hypothetical protein
MLESVEKYLTCVICQDIYPDLMYCINSHPHCQSCLDSMTLNTSCSICRSRMGWRPSRIATDIAAENELEFSCGLNGCPHRCGIFELSEHRATCPYKTFMCPMGCEECELSLKEMIEHLKIHRKHVKTLNNNNVVNMLIKLHELPAMYTFIIDNKEILSLYMNFRLSFNIIELRVGLLGNIGSKSPYDVCIKHIDLNSKDEATFKITPEVYEKIDNLKVKQRINYYNNYSVNDTEPIINVSSVPYGVDKYREELCEIIEDDHYCQFFPYAAFEISFV